MKEEQNLNRMIQDCRKSSCPLYSAFWDEPNAQAQYRVDHFKWSNQYKPRHFKIGDEKFGAKLALIMESPPPRYLEYFYGPDGGFSKELSLFKNVVFTLARIENKRDLLTQEKEPWLKWFASLGIVIIDAAKCRMQISDAFMTDKVTPSQIKKSFTSCSDILKLQLKEINPFRVAIGIASVYDTEVFGSSYVYKILSELGNSNSFINKRTVSLWYDQNTFLGWLEEIWLQVKNDLSNYKVEYI